jgi:hypothetical protein
MATFRDPLKSGLNEYYGKLKQTVEGLSPAELLWQPGPESNHILWTVWHMARVSDRWANATVLGGEELWTRDGWAKKLDTVAVKHLTKFAVFQQSILLLS